MSDPAGGAEIEAVLTTETFGHPLRHYPIAVTTDALALAWARKEEGPEGATVMADQELAPRQRKGPVWTAFPGLGLYFSVVLRPNLPPEGENLLWLLASLAAAEGLDSVTGVETSMKWPDDILVGDRKIAGVTVEAQLGPGEILSAILTFRVNVNIESPAFSPELRDRATSVLEVTGRPVDREKVLDAILGALERRYDDDVPDLLEGYRARCETIGKKVRALLLPRGEASGTATAVDDFGSLVLDVGGKPTTINIEVLKKLEPAATVGGAAKLPNLPKAPKPA